MSRGVRRDRMTQELALRNCLALANRHKGEGDWAHVIRFCEGAGLESSVLRTEAVDPSLPGVRERLKVMMKEASQKAERARGVSSTDFIASSARERAFKAAIAIINEEEAKGGDSEA